MESIKNANQSSGNIMSVDIYLYILVCDITFIILRSKISSQYLKHSFSLYATLRKVNLILVGRFYSLILCRNKDPIPFWKPKYKTSTIEFGIVVDKTLYENMKVSR